MHETVFRILSGLQIAMLTCQVA